MLDLETNSPLTAHSCNMVPFILVDDYYKDRSLRGNSSLRDIAPTILDLLDLKVPEEMTGKSLLSLK